MLDSLKHTFVVFLVPLEQVGTLGSFLIFLPRRIAVDYVELPQRRQVVAQQVCVYEDRWMIPRLYPTIFLLHQHGCPRVLDISARGVNILYKVLGTLACLYELRTEAVILSHCLFTFFRISFSVSLLFGFSSDRLDIRNNQNDTRFTFHN